MTIPIGDNIVTLDVESTGLDPELHELIEVAWAVGDGPVQSVVLPHGGGTADPESLAVNRYAERGFSDRSRWGGMAEILALHEALLGRMVAGSNPRGLDLPMLSRAFRTGLGGRWAPLTPWEPWHHRTIDVPQFVAGALGWPHGRGLATSVDALRKHGFDIPEPDHTAAADVAAAREAYRAYLTLAQELAPAREARRKRVTAALVERQRGGRWTHCSPPLLASGVSCHWAIRRPCECDPRGSHDHWVSNEDLAAT